MKNTKSFAAIIFILGIWYSCPVFAQGELADVNKADEANRVKPSAIMSEEVREMFKSTWVDTSFGEHISLLTNKQRASEEREIILAKLSSKKYQLKEDELNRLLQIATRIAKDPNETGKLSARAIGVMSNISEMMYEKGEITREEEIREKQFLMDVARDDTKDLSLRSSAIKAIEVLKITEADSLLKDLLADPNNLNTPEIAKSGCLALVRLASKDSFKHIAGILNGTTNPSIFGTSAYCLGHIKSPEAMVALMQNDEKFPDTGAADFALVDMEQVIYEVLIRPNDPNLPFAIRATRHLWRDGQKQKYKPLLYKLLVTAPLPEKKIVIERLLNEAGKLPFDDEKKELRKILIRIGEQSELKDHAEDIRRRLSAKIVIPKTSNIKVPKAK